MTIHTDQKETIDALLREVAAACDALPDDREAMARELIDRLVGKWSLWVLTELAAEKGPLRFSRLHERVEGVSQKVLTQTLRHLERDGLITRRLYAQVPPRVDYELTALGREALLQLIPVWGWVAAKADVFEAARRKFDADKAANA